MKNHPIQLQRARILRKKMTPQEAKLWKMLRNKKVFLYHFKRQQPIEMFIVDFYCFEKRLVIEIDGSQHGEAEAVRYDDERTKRLEARGYTVIRFWNQDIDMHLSDVVEAIRRMLA